MKLIALKSSSIILNAIKQFIDFMYFLLPALLHDKCGPIKNYKILFSTYANTSFKMLSLTTTLQFFGGLIILKPFETVTIHCKQPSVFYIPFFKAFVAIKKVFFLLFVKPSHLLIMTLYFLSTNIK